MNPIEALAVILGIINVTLVVRRSIWNYPFAIIMVTLYAHIFYGAKLYSDALLQIFFVAVNAYGWWYWRRSQAEAGDIRVEILSWSQRLLWLSGISIAVFLWGMFMHHHTDATYPWWDGAIAMISVAAQILMSRRYIENWILWIVVDILAIGLFYAKELYLTSSLYVVFLALSIWGFEEWLRTRRAAQKI